MLETIFEEPHPEPFIYMVKAPSFKNSFEYRKSMIAYIQEKAKELEQNKVGIIYENNDVYEDFMDLS